MNEENRERLAAPRYAGTVRVVAGIRARISFYEEAYRAKTTDSE